MVEKDTQKLITVLEDIRRYFHFLFERGFVIHTMKRFSKDDWRVVLAQDNFGIVIYSDQGEIGVLLSPVNSNLQYRIGLTAMIYYLSKGQVFIGQLEKPFFNARRKRFEKLAGLLKEYIDQILPYFGTDYEKHRHELMVVQQKYLDIFLKKYIPHKRN